MTVMPRQTIYSQHHNDLYTTSNNLPFGLQSSLSTNHSINKKPPLSAPTSLRNRHCENQTRPESLQNRRTFTSPESQLLEKWSEDLQQYEMVLDSMVSTSLDSNVKEEIKHVDQWYRYLSETERTATIYALLQHSTPLQSRFFITVLQQLGKKDPVTSLLSPVYTEFDVSQIDPTAANNSYCEPNNGDNQTNRSKNRQFHAFGEMEESLLQRQPFVPFADVGGGLCPSSSSSSSSGGRRLSGDFLDTPASRQFSTSASSSSNWTHRSINTGLCTGNQDPPSYSRHTGDRPKSADFSHWSFDLSPPHPDNNGSNNHRQQTSFLAPSTSGTLPMTPTSPTRLSWHGLTSLATDQYSDSIFCPSNTQQNSKKVSEAECNRTGDSMDSLADKLNQWSLYPTSDLVSNGNKQQLYGQSQTSNQQNDGNDSSQSIYYRQVYPSTTSQQPSPSTFSTISHTTNTNSKKVVFGLQHSDYYNNHQKNTISTTAIGQNDILATTSQFTGTQQKDRYHIEQVQIKLLENIPAWLKSLRLHKYTHLFRSMTWQTMIQLSDDDLKEKGVHTLGARRKLLKVFDQVKNHCELNDIKYEIV